MNEALKLRYYSGHVNRLSDTNTFCLVALTWEGDIISL